MYTTIFLHPLFIQSNWAGQGIEYADMVSILSNYQKTVNGIFPRYEGVQ